MKASSVLAIASLALGVTSYTHTAKADSTDANCEVRKDGDTLSLKPTGSANHYKDQKGNKVVRTSAGGNTQEFKWEGGRKLTVTFNSGSYGNRNYNGNYSINRLSNGGFEVVWPQNHCIATFNSRGASADLPALRIRV